MIVTQSDARLTLFAVYGADANNWRLTTKCQLAMIPVFKIQLGTPVLAWRKLESGKDSLVHIGRVSAGGAVDWDWMYPGASNL